MISRSHAAFTATRKFRIELGLKSITVMFIGLKCDVVFDL